MYRRRNITPTWLIALISALALLLILSGFALIIFATNNEYRSTLNNDATSYARSTARTNAQNRSTAQALDTAIANNNASATAQTNATAAVTAQTVNATATASTIESYLSQATSGTTALSDPLADNTGGNQWDESQNTNDAACVFTGGEYHSIEARQGYLQPCIAESSNFSDFAYQIQITITNGRQAGILFRANSANGSYYFFRIGVDGSYALDLYTSVHQAVTLLSGYSVAITSGLNQSNTLAVLAYQSTFYFYANQTLITSATDNTLTSGSIGVAAIDYSNPTDAAFSSAQVWQITSAIFTLPSPQPSPSPNPSPSATETPTLTPTVTASPTATTTTTPTPSITPTASP